jgi:protein-S-isoprenylcysteine O-methyltransferase Ste14
LNYLPFSMALWVVWLFYWAYASRVTGRPALSETTPSRVLHLSLMGAAFCLLFVQLRRPALLTSQWVPTGEPVAFVGLLVQTGGFVIAVWARRHLGMNWSGSVQLKHGHRVVRSGPYAFVRHPIYAGVLLAMLGTAMVGGRLQNLLAVALMLGVYVRKMRREEELLLRLLGDEYRVYRRQVGALIPFVL